MKCSADVSATRSKSRSRFRQAQLRRSRLIYTRRTTRSKKAIASWCKCKAPGFPSSTATRRNSFPTFLRRKNPTTRRPRSASTVRNGFLRASKFPFFLLLRPQPTELSLKGGLWLCGAGHMSLLRQTAQVRPQAAAVKRTTSFSSSRAALILGIRDRSSRRAIASSAAARTCKFLSPAALTKASAASGSGSWASFFAAAAPTGEESFFVTVLNSPYLLARRIGGRRGHAGRRRVFLGHWTPFAGAGAGRLNLRQTLGAQYNKQSQHTRSSRCSFSSRSWSVAHDGTLPFETHTDYAQEEGRLRAILKTDKNCPYIKRASSSMIPYNAQLNLGT